MLISGCAGNADKPDPTATWTVEQLYSTAKDDMNNDRWSEARTHLTAIESRFPFGVYAQQADLNLAYVNWKDGERDQALADVDRFMRLYPNHPGTDYALYLKGLITFSQAGALGTWISGQDPAERDPKGLHASYDAFSELVKRFPESRYAKDAKLRMVWLVNALAMGNVYVANYYYQHGSYLAAADRAQTVITDFSGVPAAEPALYIMTLAYGKLGMTKLQQDSERVLDENYPNSKYKKDGLALLTKKAWWQVF
ncbi:outer membrane protein assembly factor BamD [Bordetella sp. FB-8]|uniref:outer membrane protein assembly factor BamD n=1 Tax=Bordetella sp. FB-8 TaxID=1159870 RepID=UPI000524CF0B|nr:outer membrane protein assembly factor BamD [Bordetella sp. FB-8]